MVNIANIVLNFLSNIKWTPLKISVLVNIVLISILVFLFSGKEEVIDPVVETKTVYIEVPAKEGKLDTVYLPQPYPVTNPVNQDLLDKYESLRDSVARKELFKEAITENEYKETYEDSIVKIDVYTKVRGTLLKQASNYFVKPSRLAYKDTVTIIKPYTPKVHLYGGLEVGIPTENIINPSIKGTLMFQDKKGNMLTAGYDTNKTIWLGKTWKFF